jgi:hypothetical protein
VSEKSEAAQTIMVRLNRLDQLFNSLDPSPFHEKDLDRDAEDFIVGWLRDIGDKPFRICIGLPSGEAKVKGSEIEQAIHHHFEYRVKDEQRNLRLQFRRGRIALLIGVVFLTACLLLRALLTGALSAPFDVLVGESLLIIGWVAMWGPLDVFLYGWWPIVERLRVFRRLAKVEIEVRKEN